MATMKFVSVLSMLVSIGVCDPVFKLVNSSVQLDVPKKIVDADSAWLFNQTDYIIRYTGRLKVFGRFEGRVKFDEETHSLTLYKLQKNDSGLYQAEYTSEKREIVATHQLNVLDPVGEPVFNVSCLRSNDTSIVTFTCTAQELSITSYCYNDNCDIKGKKITEDPFFSLSLNISNNLIICNHSNPAHSETKTMERKTKKQLCPSDEPPDDPLIIILTVTIITLLLLAILFVIFFWQMKRKARDPVNTVYEAVDPVKKEEINAQSVEMSEKPEHPGTVYCTVGKPAEACSNDESTVRTANPGNKEMRRMRSKENCNDQNLCDTPDKNQGTGNTYEELESSLPQTIYATVNKGSKPM